MVRRFFFALLVLLSRAALTTASGNVPISHRHDDWGAAAGFPGGYVYAIAQTSDGYLWIATSKGLLRYDGLSFAPVAAEDTSGPSPIMGVVVDSQDALWAVDDHTHLFRYVAGRLERWPADKGPHQYVAAIAGETANGTLLFASKLQGLIEYGQGEPRKLLDPRTMPNHPSALAQTADGTFWIGSQDARLFHLSLARGAAELQPVAGLNNFLINCLLPVGSSTLLVGTDKGLWIVHDGNLIPAGRPELSNRSILALAPGIEGDVWIGTDGEVFRADAKEIASQGAIHSLDVLDVHKTVTSLFADRDGNLWIGSPEALERYRNNGFSTYLSSAGLPCGNCGAIYVDRQDRLWFAPWDGGLFRMTQGRLEAIEVAGLKNDTVYSIAGGAPNEVWLARKYGGVTRLLVNGEGLQASTYTRQNGLALDAVASIYRAADGTVWAGTLGGGVSRLQGNTWRTVTTQDGLPSNTISAITGSPAAQEIYVGTPNGLGILKNGRWTAYTARDGLPPGPMESLFLDDANRLWIGTSKGLSFLQAGVVHVPLGAPTPIYGEIVGIAERSGWLWITTRDHVLRVRLTALLEQSFDQGDYREFGLAEGLPSVEGVKRHRSVVEDDHGRLWFSLNKGISVLEPSVFTRPNFAVTTRLDGVVVDGRLLGPAENLRIPPGRHRFTFRYAGVNASNPEGVTFRYRLDNIDPGWSEPTALRDIDYTNIPPGRFQFHVVARNPDGVWNQQESTLSFEVDPAYWQTRWFQLSCAAALVLIGFGFYRSRVYQLHSQFHARLEGRVNERTRIARELHDSLLQSFQGLLYFLYSGVEMLPDHADVAKAKETLQGAIDRGQKAIQEGREAIQGLRSSTTESNDLVAALNILAADLSANRSGQTAPVFVIQVEGASRELQPILRDDVYRIAGEALRNASTHAQAKRIETEIHYDDHRFRVRIRDDGIGMDSQVAVDKGRAGHWGLRGMHERAKLVGGNLRVWSKVGYGTEIELTIPASTAYAKASPERRSRFTGKGNPSGPE